MLLFLLFLIVYAMCMFSVVVVVVDPLGPVPLLLANEARRAVGTMARREGIVIYRPMWAIDVRLPAPSWALRFAAPMWVAQ